MDRRQFLMGSTVAGAMLAAGGCSTLADRSMGLALDPDVTELQRRTFDWFVHVTDVERGLTPDRWP
ncbi:twin-arginine translocation signal domain-containing protein, partial [Brevundimonas sp.]|uniref:twin-arginine translocation signal domain-containing protein n=1 Tax=Brevundimonas sp. TaxID=1871086 RepID=UPI00391DDDA2